MGEFVAAAGISIVTFFGHVGASASRSSYSTIGVGVKSFCDGSDTTHPLTWPITLVFHGIPTKTIRTFLKM